MGDVLAERAPMAAVAELDEAREAYRRALVREAEIRCGDAEAELGVVSAEERLEVEKAKYDELTVRQYEGTASGVDAVALQAAIRDAGAHIAEAEAALASRAKLAEHAEGVTKRARERLDGALKRAIDGLDRKLAERQRAKEAERDRAAAEAGLLEGIRTSAGQARRGSLGARATVDELERTLASMEAAL